LLKNESISISAGKIKKSSNRILTEKTNLFEISDEKLKELKNMRDMKLEQSFELSNSKTKQSFDLSNSKTKD